MSGEFQFLIELAERGTANERRAALGVMGGILQATSQGAGTLPPELAAWIGSSLVKIAEGADPKAALSLKVSENKSNSYVRTEIQRREVATLRTAGASKEEALAAVADKLGIEQEALEQRLRRL